MGNEGSLPQLVYLVRHEHKGSLYPTAVARGYVQLQGLEGQDG
jgi:hypothetical protein